MCDCRHGGIPAFAQNKATRHNVSCLPWNRAYALWPLIGRHVFDLSVFESILEKNPDLLAGDSRKVAYYRQLLRLVGLTHYNGLFCL